MSQLQPKSRGGSSRSESPSKPETSSRIQETDLFDILSHHRRRYLVHAIESASEKTDVGTLAEEIAAWELGIEPAEVSSQQRKRLYTSIQQQHLPRMAEAGLIDFDTDRGVVESSPALEDAEVYLEIVYGNEIPWSELYLGLSGVFAALTAVVWLGIWPFSAVSPVAWLTVVITTMAAAAACHNHQDALSRLGTGGPPPEHEPRDDQSEGR